MDLEERMRSASRNEEIISTLWVIAATLCFANEYTTFAWAFSIKAAFDTMCSILYSLKANIEKEKQKSNP